MSDTELEPTYSSPKSGSKNFQTSHIYDDGNIQLDVRGTLFKVHKSILAMRSETFHDMFSLPQVHPATDGQNVKLDDSPQAFDNLMNAVYKGVEFLRDTPVNQFLDVIELTRKYQMHALEANLQQHLLSLLPSSAEEVFVPNWKGFAHYKSNPSLARTVLRLGPKELHPWAFYSMGTRLISTTYVNEKPTYEPPPMFLTLDGAFTYSLLILLQFIRSTRAKWDKRISEFYLAGCAQANITSSTTAAPICPRYTRKFDGSSPLYPPPEETCVFIVGAMTSRIKRLNRCIDEDINDYGRWCSKCKSSLKKVATDIVLEFYQGLVECTARLDCTRL